MSELVKQHCESGHVWVANMYYELGGWFYNDESAASCPTCGQDALDKELPENLRDVEPVVPDEARCSICWMLLRHHDDAKCRAEYEDFAAEVVE